MNMVIPSTSDKEKAIKDFLASLKITIKNASIYNLEHPAYKSSIEELKEKIENIFLFISPVRLSFTSNSLLIQDSSHEMEDFHVDLARMFHHRKIKTLKISPGVSQHELATFLSCFYLPPEQIFEQGGVNNLLKDQNILHIQVEELDYSRLFKGEGEEIENIWDHLLQDTIRKKERKKIIEAADNFVKISGRLNPQVLIEDTELNENFQRFFSYLKKEEESKFRTCAKELLKTSIKDKELSTQEKIDGLKQLITDLKEEDFASTLWEEIVTDDQFDALSFSIFSRLVDKQKHTKIAHSFSEIFEQNRTLERNPQVREKIRELLSGTSSPLISKIYQQTLSSLVKDLNYQPELSFDKHLLFRNFRFILLNILKNEQDEQLIKSLLEDILKEWEKIAEERDFEYLKLFFQIVQEKKDIIKNETLFTRIYDLMANLVESAILEGDSSLYFEYFLRNLKESTLDVNSYLETIFTENRITPYILKAFFQLHQEYIFYFNLNLEQKSADTIFLERLCQNLSHLDEEISMITLKRIYQFSNKNIKIKSLRAMQSLSEFDVPFLTPIIKKRDSALVKEALVILARDEKAREKAFKKLLMIQSPYGFRNRRILKNIKAVEDKNLQEAQAYLQALCQRKSFWNKNIREKASQVLQSWHDRTN